MSHPRRAVALVGAIALAVAMAAGTAQAESRSGIAPVDSTGPSLQLTDGARNWASPDGTYVLSPFFAGHVWTGGDADETTTAEFQAHKWECSEDEGVLASILTYDDMGAFNGGPGIFQYCLGGEKTYDAVFLDWSLGTVDIVEEVASGDRVVMTVTRAGGVPTYSMENLTAGWSASTQGTGDYANSMVETGDAAIALNGVAVPPPAFGRDAVKRVQFDGVDLSAADTKKSQMVAADGTTILERATKYRKALPDERFSLINKSNG